MSEKGYESALYVNTGTFAVPVWTEIDLARDVTHGLDVAEIDATARLTARLGREASEYGLGKWAAEFESLIPNVGDTNAAFDALLAANRGRTSVDILVVEGGIITTDGLNATRAICAVLGGKKSEPLKDMSTRAFNCIYMLNTDMDIEQYGATSGGDFVEGS